MNTNRKTACYALRARTVATMFLLACIGQLVAQPANENGTASRSLSDGEIVSMIAHCSDPGRGAVFGVTQEFNQASENRNKNIQKLLAIFRDPGSSRDAKCAAAYYLGQLHASEAADSLAGMITLSDVRTGHLSVDEALWNHDQAANALVSIGTPAIPALIRNLEDSDDEKIRALSLRTLSRIEGDKDIVQIRLQKGAKAETDPKKQERLQAALKALGEMK